MQSVDKNTDNTPIEYYQIQCANCKKSFAWHQAYWQSRTPGSQDDAGYDYVSRAFCPHCGAIVCEGIGSSYWKWHGDNRPLNANNPLPPALPPDLEWIPDDKRGEEFMEEFHSKWGKRQLPKDLWMPVSQQYLDLSLLGIFKEIPFQPKKARPYMVLLAKLREYLVQLRQGNKKKETYFPEDDYYQIKVLTNDKNETCQEQHHQKSEFLPEGWFSATPEESLSLWDELQNELPVGHILFHKPVKVIAHRSGATDDILCHHLNESNRYTIVHLTWSMRTEINEKYPTVEVDGSFEDFQNYEKNEGNEYGTIS
jgi:hypothetical protein